MIQENKSPVNDAAAKQTDSEIKQMLWYRVFGEPLEVSLASGSFESFKKDIIRAMGGSRKDGQRPLHITAHDCVDKTYMIDNYNENKNLFPKWIKLCCPNNEEIMVVSGGPSMKTQLEKIRELYSKGVKIICVKHSHNFLIDNGIIPWACINIDPRPLDGESPHMPGVMLDKLMATPHPDVIYFLASVVHPSVTKFLLEKGMKIVGFNAYSEALKEVEEVGLAIQFGTCSAVRAIMLARALGFQRQHLFGFDACFYEDKSENTELNQDGMRKFIKISKFDRMNNCDKSYWTTPELVAMIQDMEQFFARFGRECGIEVIVYPDGIIYDMWRNSDERCWPTYSEVL